MGMNKTSQSSNAPVVKTWPAFARRVRSRGCSLLRELDRFPASVLVAGCQRSGTTMLSRVITQSDGMVNYWFGRDDELDAALILSGHVTHHSAGRYCFQTTYLNQCYREYFEHPGMFQLIWVLRNPYSVVYSLAYNWSRFARNELFHACGIDAMSGADLERLERHGAWIIGKLRRACYAYNGKVSQLFELIKRLDDKTLLVVDYDDLVNAKEHLLPAIYDFISLPYESRYAEAIHAKSLKRAQAFNVRQHVLVESICSPVYEQARRLLSVSMSPR